MTTALNNPKNYVDIQRKVNAAHLDGRQEHQYEEAIFHAGTFATWLKSFDLPAKSFLDAGCRTGYAMEALAKHFPSCEVIGIDIVPEFVEIASLRGETKVGDIQCLPFKAETFDWVFSCTTIEHCPNLKQAITEMQRVSRYGFYIQTDLENDDECIRNLSHFSNLPTPDEWVDVFRHPAWWLVYLKLPRHNRIEMIWLRKEHIMLLSPTNG